MKIPDRFLRRPGEPLRLGEYACPCCGFQTLSEEPPGTYEICKFCSWEDDNVQYHDPDFTGGANGESLNRCRKRFEAEGLPELRKFVEENGFTLPPRPGLTQ